MKKQTLLLGTLGAAAALGSSAAIHVIPVHAAQESESTTISVTVLANAPTITVSGLGDNELFTTTKISPIKISYTYANQLTYKLSYFDAAGRQTDYIIAEKDVTSNGSATNGTDTINLDLAQYGGEYGRYVLKAINKGTGTVEDSVTFRYSPIARPESVGTDEGGNPVVDVEVSDDTDYVVVELIDKDGNIKYTFKVPAENGKVHVNLVEIADKYGINIEDGEYTIKLIPYDKNGIRLNVESIQYDIKFANAMKVPDTGEAKNMIAELGLSDSDIIAVFCVLFSAAIVGGVVALTKTRRHNRR